MKIELEIENFWNNLHTNNLDEILVNELYSEGIFSLL